MSVTLLFSDIESSTRLVERLGDEWLAVLGAQQALMREAVTSAGGRELDCRGDEFSIAFDRADDAVSAAVAAQQAFAAHAWPNGAEVKVRMGIHTGMPTPAGPSYVGLDVHRTARICAAGHGGQVLLSAAVRQALPSIEARDLGQFELRGLPGPERIFQLVAPGLREDFPPPRVETFTVQAVSSDIRPVKIVIAEDSVLLREGIVRLLEEAGMEVVGQAGTAEELLLRVRSYKPDVAIVDIRMPPTHTDEGVRAAKEIREKHPNTAVLVLSQYVEPAYAMELLAESAEGVGYLLKDRVADVPDFVAAVRRVAEGGSALDPAVVSQLVGRRRADDPLSELTPREREVLELMAEGRSNLAIAERMVVTERAVEKHVTSIFSKLRLPPTADAHRRVLAVLAFLRT
jgi:DNA-binding NarL/FixJ family response regulator/class 3 adenylate cyclase